MKTIFHRPQYLFMKIDVNYKDMRNFSIYWMESYEYHLKFYRTECDNNFEISYAKNSFMEIDLQISLSIDKRESSFTQYRFVLFEKTSNFIFFVTDTNYVAQMIISVLKEGLDVRCFDKGITKACWWL
ncbi:hypothetical protein RF11_15416 [Thelohanellus kitauei]|uniref:Uncharacterized protein n=1 Tax=Thelohanellus kitauei TaxID=669202 RepID=A0A0C2JY90_THEKT|nr:hypothetical protein RF11_15416 [Thelohanellus kitauei]